MNEEEKLQFKFPKHEIEEIVHNELKAKAKNISFKGFRPGKAPFEFIKKKYYESTFDSVTRDKLIGLVDEYRRSKKLAGVIPTDVVYQVVDNDVVCDVTVVQLIGVNLDKLESELFKDEIRVSVWKTVDENSLKLIQDAIKEAFSHYTTNDIKENIDSDCELLLSVEKPVQMQIISRNLSFDNYANKIFSDLEGKTVGSRISLTHEYRGKEYEFEIVVTQIRKTEKRNPQDLPTDDQIKSILDKMVQELNDSIKFETVRSQVLLNVLKDENFKESLKRANNYLRLSDTGSIERIIFSHIFELLNLTISDEEFKQELLNFFSRSGIDPTKITPSEFDSVRNLVLSGLKTAKVTRYYLDRVKLNEEQEDSSLDLYLSFLRIQTLRVIFDRICSQIAQQIDKETATNQEAGTD